MQLYPWEVENAVIPSVPSTRNVKLSFMFYYGNAPLTQDAFSL